MQEDRPGLRNESERKRERLRERDRIEIQLILEFIELGEGHWPSAFAH